MRSATTLHNTVFSTTTGIIRVFEQQDLVSIATMPMPFGKYRDRLLIDLPEPYLLWFANQGFPEGRLGMLLALTLEIKSNGLESIIEPLKKSRARPARERSNR